MRESVLYINSTNEIMMREENQSIAQAISERKCQFYGREMPRDYILYFHNDFLHQYCQCAFQSNWSSEPDLNINTDESFSEIYCNCHAIVVLSVRISWNKFVSIVLRNHSDDVIGNGRHASAKRLFRFNGKTMGIPRAARLANSTEHEPHDEFQISEQKAVNVDDNVDKCLSQACSNSQCQAFVFVYSLWHAILWFVCLLQFPIDFANSYLAHWIHIVVRSLDRISMRYNYK